MKIKYFVGLEHQKIHSIFLQEVLGGDFVHYPCTIQTSDFTEVLKHDSPDTLWIFNDFFFHLHPKLKGRQVHVGHGLGFKNTYGPQRVLTFNQYMDLGFATGVPNLSCKLKAGFSPAKIREIGYWTGFQIPDVPTKPNAVLFASTYYQSWDHFRNMRNILAHLNDSLEAHLTIHPDTPEAMKRCFWSIAKRKRNIILAESQEDLLRSAALCSCAVASSGSVPTLMWFQKKPVLFIRGGMSWLSRFRPASAGWSEVKKKVEDPLFSEILDQSVRIHDWQQFSPGMALQAKHVPASEKIFFPWSYDRNEVTRRIQDAIQEVQAMGPKN